MPSNFTTAQGQMWDQVALAQYGSEKRMALLLAANADEMDTLLFSGETALEIPEPPRDEAMRSLPPWERM